MPLTHAQEIESLRRRIDAQGLRIAKMGEPTAEKIREVEAERKLMEKIIADRRSMTLPGDAAAGKVETQDDDDILADEIFLAGGGNTGKEPLPDQLTDDPARDDADERLAQQIFDAA